MISNPTGASHKDRASIVALGDTLAARGQLHAAHFCYLVAGVDWGSYACKDSKLVLIGASHLLPFQVLKFYCFLCLVFSLYFELCILYFLFIAYFSRCSKK